jgi:hypothetical protein
MTCKRPIESTKLKYLIMNRERREREREGKEGRERERR